MIANPVPPFALGTKRKIGARNNRSISPNITYRFAYVWTGSTHFRVVEKNDKEMDYKL